MKKITLNSLTFWSSFYIYIAINILFILERITNNTVLSIFLSTVSVLASMCISVNYFGNAVTKQQYPQLRTFIIPLSGIIALTFGLLDIISVFDKPLTYQDKHFIQIMRSIGLYIYSLWLLFYTKPEINSGLR